MRSAELGAHVAHWWALHHLFSGELVASIDRYREAIAVHAEVGDSASVLTAQFQLALAEANHSRLREALETCGQVLENSGEQGERWTHAYSQWVTGVAWWRLGNMDQAKSAALAALEIQQDFTDGICTALTLELLAWIESSNGQHELACSLLGAAQRVWTNLGTTVDAFGPHLAAESRQMAEQLRSELGSARIDQVVEEFAHTTKAEAIALALGADAKGVAIPVVESPLTKRELDVARLVAQGMSNREVAAALVISPRTVDGHVERILGKLGFDSRTQVASWLSAWEGTAAVSGAERR